jgi:hypothetical protein
MATTNSATPYTIEAEKDEDLPSARPIRKPPTNEGGGDEDGGLGECAEEYLLRDLSHGAADLLEQVVSLVGNEECICEDEHEAARESPREVGAFSRIDIERARNFPR